MAQPVGKQKLASIVYKDFTFPFNPATTTYKIDRSYIEHKYPELKGNELEDFGPDACIVGGEGAFFGKGCYSNWRKLLKEFKKGGVGNISHPIFTDVTRGLMVSLTGRIEAIDSYISYSFEIIADTAPSIDECLGKYVSVVSTPVQTEPVQTSTAPARNEFVHTVVKGECLSVICARYASKFGTTISWKKIAEYNNMSNPHLIYPGDKIKIYYPT